MEAETWEAGEDAGVDEVIVLSDDWGPDLLSGLPAFGLDMSDIVRGDRVVEEVDTRRLVQKCD